MGGLAAGIGGESSPAALNKAVLTVSPGGQKQDGGLRPMFSAEARSDRILVIDERRRLAVQ